MVHVAVVVDLHIFEIVPTARDTLHPNFLHEVQDPKLLR